MKKHYVLFFFFLITVSAFSQERDSIQEPVKENSPVSKSAEIEGFRMYPNPITGGILNILTQNNGIKRIQIYDILGKQVYARHVRDRQVDLSSLQSGVYILKVTENTKTTTRKLVIKWCKPNLILKQIFMVCFFLAWQI